MVMGCKLLANDNSLPSILAHNIIIYVPCIYKCQPELCLNYDKGHDFDVIHEEIIYLINLKQFNR